ncbi:MAG: DUF3570 domain-containing protein [Acidobacteriota bacterium]
MTRRFPVSSSLAVTVAVFACLVARRNSAQNNDLNVQFHGFQDSRGVTVLSPTVDLSQDFTDRTSLRVSFGVDAISAASDSCARCHRQGVRSRRQEGGLSMTRKFDDLKFTIGAAFSQENFYRATTGLTSMSRDLANGNATVAAGFSFSFNQPTLHPLPDRENQYASSAYASITQTLTKTTIAQAGYEVGKIAGYQDNPFLRASVNGIMVLGQVPDTRTRQTVTARIRQALPAQTFIEADYRHYFDDWQLRSNTLSVGVSHRFSEQWLLNVSYRRNEQTGASFYQPQYVGAIPQFFTADFRLAPFNSDNYTGRLVVTPKGQLLGLPAGTGLTVQYDRYRADNGFEAAIISTGLRVPLKLR